MGLAGMLVYLWLQHTHIAPMPAPSQTQVHTPAAEPAAPPTPPVEEPVVSDLPAQEQEQLALPKFDFYKILPGVEVKVPDAELVAPKADERPAQKIVSAAKPPPNNTVPSPTATGVTAAAPATAVPATYILQVGAFQTFDEADQSKAQLALQGIQAKIQRVLMNGKEVWQRVQVGPFQNVNAAQQMRARLSQLGVHTVLTKVGGSPSPKP